MRCPTTEFFLCGRSSKTFLLASLSGERCSGGQLLSTFSDLAGGLLLERRWATISLRLWGVAGTCPCWWTGRWTVAWRRRSLFYVYVYGGIQTMKKLLINIETHFSWNDSGKKVANQNWKSKLLPGVSFQLFFFQTLTSDKVQRSRQLRTIEVYR